MSEKKPVKREVAVDPNDLSAVLQDAPPGAWVALSHDKTRIVATGNSMKAAVFTAELHGERDPILIKMPLEGEGIAAGVR